MARVISKSWVMVLVCGLLLAAVAAPVVAPRTALAAPANIVVDNQGDDASCSGFLTLRCAINEANGAPFSNIRFAPAIHTILLQGTLPTITANGTWIDGYGGGSSCVCPSLDGTSWSGTGSVLTISADDVTITNINIANIPSDGADIRIIGGAHSDISNDGLGIQLGAAQCPASASTVGVEVLNDTTGSAGSLYNGTAYIYNDTISCHGGSGIEVIGSNYVYIGLQRDDATPAGNHIGTTSDGTGAVGNGYDGVRVASASDQITIRHNLIVHNGNGGVTLDGTNMDVSFNTLSANNIGLAAGGGITQTIIGNNIGTSADGLSALPNAHEGILITGGTGLFLSDNVVAHNGGAGLAVTGNTTQALIENNSIAHNGGLPIDLGDDGPSPNGHNIAPGPNNWQAYPVITAASGSLIQGTTCPNCTVYIYRAIGNPALPGGGGVFLTNTPAGPTGLWGTTLPAGVTAADISLTAFNAAGDSSEMSPRVVASPRLHLFLPLMR